MANTKKINATTQKFTEIVDFVDDIVVLEGGNACMIIEITASNFALLSRREQDTRIFSYASLLNSLSFPIQILIRNKRIDISQYIKELDDVVNSTKSPQLRTYVEYYRTFVNEMVTVNVVLSKSFYLVIPYSALEEGVTTVAQSRQKGPHQTEIFAQNAKKALQTKADTLLAQLQKFAMSARLLEREDLIKLFYDIYNQGVGLEVEQVEPGINATVITGETK